MTEEELRIERIREVKKCTWVGFGVNGLLSLLKILAGIFGKSGAMIADGVHSLSDFITDVIVIIFVGISARGENKLFRYGHGKFETFATMLISVALFGVAVFIFYDGFIKVHDSLNGKTIPNPTYLALAMAVISIVAKEGLYRYTKHVGERVNSMAVIANAWHHRSDAFSSIATLIGISGAMFLGPKWHLLDPIAEMLVSVFIGIVAYKLLVPSVKELLEVSLSDEENTQIGKVICSVKGVEAYHHLRTRKNGNLYIFDFHIKVNPMETVMTAHDISTNVENALKEKYGNVISNIHIEPYLGESIDCLGQCSD